MAGARPIAMTTSLKQLLVYAGAPLSTPRPKMKHINNTAPSTGSMSSVYYSRRCLLRTLTVLVLLVVFVQRTEGISARSSKESKDGTNRLWSLSLMKIRSGALSSSESDQSKGSSLRRPDDENIDTTTYGSRTTGSSLENTAISFDDLVLAPPTAVESALIEAKTRFTPIASGIRNLKLSPVTSAGVNVAPIVTRTERKHRWTASAPESALRVVYAVSFLLSLSCSMVALTPAQALVEWMTDKDGISNHHHSGSSTATTMLLSSVTAAAALLEITTSHWVGAVALDRWGRQLVLKTIVLVLTIAHAATAWHPSISTVCADKLLGLVAIGFFTLTVQTILTDLVGIDSAAAVTVSATIHDSGTTIIGPGAVASTTPSTAKTGGSGSRLSAAMGLQMAFSGVGFLTGMLCAGQLVSVTTLGKSRDGFSVVYGTSALVGAVAVLLIQIGLPETSTPTTMNHSAVQRSMPVKRTQWWKSIASCTGLLTRHGGNVRILAVLLMLMTFPMFMGDMFLVYAKSEWDLTPKQLSSFFALFGGMNILSNAMGSVLVRRIGIRQFTALAVTSKLVTTVGMAFFGYRGSVVGMLLGFLGAAQALGIVAALVAAGTATGLPQGELAGERAALMALLKVAGPIVYGTLLVQGEHWLGTKKLPFFFNIGLSLVALVVAWVHLQDG